MCLVTDGWPAVRVESDCLSVHATDNQSNTGLHCVCAHVHLSNPDCMSAYMLIPHCLCGVRRTVNICVSLEGVSHLSGVRSLP